jgi:hypothetical protein
MTGPNETSLRDAPAAQRDDLRSRSGSGRVNRWRAVNKKRRAVPPRRAHLSTVMLLAHLTRRVNNKSSEKQKTVPMACNRLLTKLLQT